MQELRDQTDRMAPTPPEARDRARLSRVLALLAAFALGAALPPAQAADRFAVASNNWNNTATWSTACGGAAGSSVPVAADNATICDGITVTVTADASVTAITLIGPSADNGITINSGVTLDASGAVTMDTGSNGITQTIAVGSGNLRAASIAIPGANNTRVCEVSVSTGTITVSGSITFSGAAAHARFTSTGASTVNLGGDFGGGGTLASGAGSIIRLNGTAATQTLGLYTTYNNIEIDKSAGEGRLTAGTTVIGGTLRVRQGVMDIRSSTVTVNSTTTVDSGATLEFTTSNTGNKTFVGMVTIDGSWVNTANETPFFQGGLTFNGSTFTSGTGTYTFQTNSQDVSGTQPITFAGSVAISGAITVTNRVSHASGITVTATTGITGSAGGSTWAQDTSSTLVVTGPLVNPTGTLSASATGNTIEFAGATAQTIKVPSTSYYNLKTSGTSTKTMPASALTINGSFTHNGTSATASTAGGAMTVAGNFSIGTGATFAGSTFTHSVGGNWTNDGTFTAGTSTIRFSDGAAQALGGSNATTFSGLTMDNTVGSLTINLTPTVSGALTFTNGRMVAVSPTVVIVDTAGTSSGGSAGSHMNGCIRKNYLAAATGFTFRIGDGTNYTPVTQTFNTTAVATGDVTACVTGTDHPQVTSPIATTGIDRTKSVNRYWTLTANAGGTGTPTGAYGVSFTYAGGSPVDNDGTGYASYIIERFVSGSPGSWFPTTISGTPTSTSAATTNSQTTGYGDYAIGEPFSGFTPVPGDFNAFETGTPASAILGKLNTRVAGLTTGTFSVVAINSARTAVATLSTTVNVYLLDSSVNTGGTFDGDGCYSEWKYAANGNKISVGPAPTPNTVVTFSATSRVNTVSFTTPASAAYPDARLYMVDSSLGTVTGCSNDRFAVRPRHLTLEGLDATWQTAGTVRTLNNTGATGGVVHAAARGTAGTARPFTLRATFKDSGGNTTANVSGSYAPAAKAGSPTCGTLCASVGTLELGGWASFSSGVGTVTANYSEAGTVNIELEDTSFTAVDRSVNDGTPDSNSNSFPYGSRIPQGSGSPAPVEIGRFVPDHFDLSAGTSPVFKTFNSTTCAGRSFTYAGQPFGYATPPTATVAARNGNNEATVNYRTSLGLFKLTGAMITETYAVATGTLDTALKGTAQISEIANTGTGTYTPGATSRVAFARDVSPTTPFAGDITLTINAKDTSEVSSTVIAGNPDANGIPTNTPVSFSSIAFNGGVFAPSPTIPAGAAIVFGRARLQNTTGSELIGLTVPFRTEYYTGAGFATNASDSCSSFASANFTFISSSYSGTLNGTNLPDSKIVFTGPTLSSGVGLLKINPPGAGITGSARLCLDLDAGASGDTSCQAATPADQTWLQGPWGSTGYTRDPNARAAFGLYGAQPNSIIFMRENY